MVAVVPAESVDPVLRVLGARGVPGWVCGEVVATSGGTTVGGAKGGDGAASLHGDYAK
jgi:hypothetical protein